MVHPPGLPYISKEGGAGGVRGEKDPTSRACLVTTVPFRSAPLLHTKRPYLPFQNGRFVWGNGTERSFPNRPLKCGDFGIYQALVLWLAGLPSLTWRSIQSSEHALCLLQPESLKFQLFTCAHFGFCD